MRNTDPLLRLRQIRRFQRDTAAEQAGRRAERFPHAIRVVTPTFLGGKPLDQGIVLEAGAVSCDDAADLLVSGKGVLA